MDEKILDGIENLTVFDSLIKANSVLQKSNVFDLRRFR